MSFQNPIAAYGSIPQCLSNVRDFLRDFYLIYPISNNTSLYSTTSHLEKRKPSQQKSVVKHFYQKSLQQKGVPEAFWLAGESWRKPRKRRQGPQIGKVKPDAFVVKASENVKYADIHLQVKSASNLRR